MQPKTNQNSLIKIPKSIFTSESVGKGHPDKICDQIADKILDAVLAQDRNTRSAIEVMASNRLIVIGGELTTSAYVDVVEQAWSVLLDLGYTYDDFSILSNVHAQSSDISQSVDKDNSDEIGAGDQGIMFGYATDETETYMPLAIQVAHELVKKAEELRQSNPTLGIKADMKSQVSIDESDPKNTKIHTVLMSIQHQADINYQEFQDQIKTLVIEPVINRYFNHPKYPYQIYINPSGRFVIGGPIGDTGLTGRKIIVDTYGGAAKHGGGAFSGKDYTKVDRSAAYAARWVAKNLVAAGVAKKIEIQIAYGIGLTKPIAIKVDHFGTSIYHPDQIVQIINWVFDLSPKAIINDLGLKDPIYYQTSFYGHFGKNHFSWEQLNRVKEIEAAIKILTSTTSNSDPILAQVKTYKIVWNEPQKALGGIKMEDNLKFNLKTVQTLINDQKITNEQRLALRKFKNWLKIANKSKQWFWIRNKKDLKILNEAYQIIDRFQN